MAQTPPAGHGNPDELKNRDGSWKYTNALVRETSPYLLQHAHNPVDWHPWGPEAFELARKRGKPIFLSIGYATCYWCHVMERQVFENPALAGQLNERFVSIKVDREERPDVDDIYMAAVQLMTRHGGWPMSVFLTPPGAAGPEDKGLKPFWAGTYIPPEPAHGLPGFGQVVQQLADAWRTDRDQVVAQADRVADAVTQHLTQRQAQGDLSADLVRSAANQLARSYDPVNGGFGSGAQGPKFPQPSSISLLIATHNNNPNPELWTAIAYTLERMGTGGLYDQVGGGFHRYSTDGQWLVPHFEKMLYDNGQLLELYADAHETKPHPKDPDFYTRIMRETADYVLREMTADNGDHLFWSAQDAEVNAHEGQNYLWTEDQVRRAIGDTKLADLAIAMYALQHGANFKDPHNPAAPPSNVLYLPVRLDKLASDRKTSLDDLAAMRQKINERLLASRDQRDQPITDDKVLVSWNSIMIAGLARAGQVLDEPRYVKAATLAADGILRLMRTTEGRLLRTRRQGESKIPAFLEDYAYFTHAALTLHRTTHDRRWLDTAVETMRLADTLFSARDQQGGGYFDTLPDQDDLFVRSISTYDGAIPSGNSQMVHNLITLHELTGEQGYLDRALIDLHAFAGALEQHGAGMAHMQHALLRVIESAPTSIGRSPQPPTPQRPSDGGSVVTATLDPSSIDLRDDAPSATVVLTIQPGYHINADQDTGQGLIPTTIRLEGAPGLAIAADFPAAVEKKYPFADEPLRVFEGTLKVGIRIQPGRPTTTQRPFNARLVIEFQACTDTACLEPDTVTIPLELIGGPG